MSIKWDEIKQDVLAQIAGANTKEEIDKLKVDILGKKGLIAGFMSQMKTLSPEEKREFGQKANELKKEYCFFQNCVRSYHFSGHR